MTLLVVEIHLNFRGEVQGEKLGCCCSIVSPVEQPAHDVVQEDGDVCLPPNVDAEEKAMALLVAEVQLNPWANEQTLGVASPSRTQPQVSWMQLGNLRWVACLTST